MSVELTLPVSSIQYRKEFHLANKETNETVDEWYRRLKKLAKPCDYGSYLDVLLLDKFVVGLDDAILENLSTEDGYLTLVNIMDLIRCYEEKEDVDIKPELVIIKEEQSLSDVGQNDDHWNDEHLDINEDNDMQPIVPYMVEAFVEKQPISERPKLFECYLCHKSWQTVGHLTYHFLRHHTIGRTLKCHLCSKWLKTPNTLIRHLNMHLSDKPYHCNLCDFSFASLVSLKRHTLQHNNSNVQSFGCSKCRKIFISKRHLRFHKQSHNNPYISLSEKIDEVVKHRDSVKSHTNTKNMETKFVCEICSTIFEHESTYDQHMKAHYENEFLCHLCGRKLRTKRNLINHYLVHTGEKPFACNDCDKVFSCIDKLKLHMKIHKGIRNHVCLICNKGFIQKGHLASHQKSHAVKTFDFKCEQCPQQFTNEKRFELHMRSHIGYECNFCGKTFKKKYHRSDHMRTHTGERPYGCSICEKKFTQRSALSGHLKWHSKSKSPSRVKKKQLDIVVVQ